MSECITPFMFNFGSRWLEPRTGHFVFKECFFFFGTHRIGGCEGLRACLGTVEKRKTS